MTLLTKWKQHPTRRKELAALIAGDPALADAIAIVKERLYTIVFPPTGGQYSLTEFYALHGAKQMGYLECLNNFLMLANLSPHKINERAPWTEAVTRGVEGVTKPTQTDHQSVYQDPSLERKPE